MDIHQISVQFDERNDRLLMRVNTLNAQEIRLWLTRRISMRLAGPLQSAITRIESAQASIAAPDAQAKALLTELKHEEFLQKADLKTPFSGEKTSLPLGPEPMLVTEITIHIQGHQGAQIVFQDAGEPGIPARSCTLQMQPALVHGMLHLLTNAMVAAQWQQQTSVVLPAGGESLRSDDDEAMGQVPKTGYTH